MAQGMPGGRCGGVRSAGGPLTPQRGSLGVPAATLTGRKQSPPCAGLARPEAPGGGPVQGTVTLMAGSRAGAGSGLRLYSRALVPPLGGIRPAPRTAGAERNSPGVGPRAHPRSSTRSRGSPFQYEETAFSPLAVEEAPPVVGDSRCPRPRGSTQVLEQRGPRWPGGMDVHHVRVVLMEVGPSLPGDGGRPPP